ncbi:ATP-binding protein [Blastococcus litoris]|uniref:ATP-binding protein n=1 Tax=Blastococcus litoris TaxID=2171622 RepID=UPI000E300906|nr:helix-turn-helix domain-containing protein [Blastococcus litoris]
MVASPPTFAVLLRSLREQAGLTQEELAERAGLTPHAISALERGARTRPYPHTVRALADGLGLDDAARARLRAAVPSRQAPATDEPQAPVQAGLRPTPLPVPPTALLGRDAEAAALAGQLTGDGVRLVTLTGVGGVGKSRLAIEVAGRAAPSFPDGVAWVPLAAVADPALVVPAIGRAVGLSGVEGLDAAVVVAGALRDARMLLVVDNLEHVLDAVAGLGELLEQCPGLVLLATSRAALRLRAEHEHPVHPLGLPERSAGAEAVAASPAGALFLARARAVAPGFEVDDGNAGDVARLCARLAGIPLALELAAAKVRVLTPELLMTRLVAAMASGGSRDLPSRQRTITATLDWSYDLLPPGEQELYRRLGVFTGGFSLDAAEAVASGGDVLAGLENLVAQSLVQVHADGRYGQLEPVLHHARTRLGEGEEAHAARLAHARYFLELAERNVPAYRRAEAVDALAQTAQEAGNFEAALESALALGEGELTGRLCWALWLDWWLHGHLRTGRRFAEAALRTELSPHTRVRALLTFSAMAFAQGDLAASAPTWTEALRLAESIGDVNGQAHAASGEGLNALATGDHDGAERAFRAGIELSAGGIGDDSWLWTLCHVWLGAVAVLRGSPEEALSLVGTGLAAARERGDRLAIYIALFTAAQAAIAMGDIDRARSQLEEGVRLSQETGDLANLAYVLDALAVVESGAGNARRVALLLGAAQALRHAVGSTVYGYYQPDESLRDAAAATARAVLGQSGYDEALEAGRRLDPDEAAELALSPDGPRLRLAT